MYTESPPVGNDIVDISFAAFLAFFFFFLVNYIRTSELFDCWSSAEVEVKDQWTAKFRCDIKPRSFFTFKFQVLVIKKQLPVIFCWEKR